MPAELPAPDPMPNILRAPQPGTPAWSGPAPDRPDRGDASAAHARKRSPAARLAEAAAAGARLTAAGQHISRRALRAAGLHGSNADLGALARILQAQQSTTTAADKP